MVKILRSHAIISLKFILVTLVLAAVPVVFYYLITSIQPDVLEINFVYPLLVLGGSIYYVFAILFFFNSFVDYYLDVWIVTNKRIIYIEQTGLFARTISELRLSRVQDVASEVKGFMQTLLGFGNIYVQTAGKEQRFNFFQVPDANHVARIILETVDRYKHENPDEQ